MTTADSDVPDEPARRRSVGRPAVLSRTVIADAALEVGFDELTLVAVAQRLGVSHAALYGHVRDRDDLVLAAAQRVVEQIEWPALGDRWRELLVAEAWTLWNTLEAHPGLLAAVGATGHTPAGIRQRVVTVCRRLVELGVAADDAVLAVDTVYDLVADSSVRVAELRSRSAEERRRLADQWSDPESAALRAAMARLFTGDPASVFQWKLDVVMAGLAATLRAADRPRE